MGFGSRARAGVLMIVPAPLTSVVVGCADSGNRNVFVVFIGGMCQSQEKGSARSCRQHGSQGKHCRFSPLLPREEAPQDLLLMLEEQGEVPLAGHKGRLAVRDGTRHRTRQCDRHAGI